MDMLQEEVRGLGKGWSQYKRRWNTSYQCSGIPWGGNKIRINIRLRLGGALGGSARPGKVVPYRRYFWETKTKIGNGYLRYITRKKNPQNKNGLEYINWKGAFWGNIHPEQTVQEGNKLGRPLTCYNTTRYIRQSNTWKIFSGTNRIYKKTKSCYSQGKLFT